MSMKSKQTDTYHMQLHTGMWWTWTISIFFRFSSLGDGKRLSHLPRMTERSKTSCGSTTTWHTRPTHTPSEWVFISSGQHVYKSCHWNSVSNCLMGIFMNGNVIFAYRKFIQIVERSKNKLTIDNIYVVIKDILDCLKRYKDCPYREKVNIHSCVLLWGKNILFPRKRR